MRKSRVLLGLVAIISYSGMDASGFAGEISDMNAYLVQATCLGGLTPNNCTSANQTKDLITTPLTFRRLDWPGAYSGLVSDNVLDPSTGAVISTFKTAPFDGPFNQLFRVDFLNVIGLYEVKDLSEQVKVLVVRRPLAVAVVARAQPDGNSEQYPHSGIEDELSFFLHR